MAIQSKCEKCGNDYLIITKEEEYYKEKDLALPKMCPECRYERRISLRNKKKLLGYNCDKCGKDIITAIEPEEGLQIYCKDCYQSYMENNDCILGYSEGAKSQKESTPTDTPQVENNEGNNGPISDPVSW